MESQESRPSVAIVAFSFAQRAREQEPNPCNRKLAEAAMRVADAHPDAPIYAQWEVALALQSRGIECASLDPDISGYVGSEDVWDEAVRQLGPTRPASIIPVAQPVLQLHKVSKLMEQSGFRVKKQHVGWVGFDRSPDNRQWWTKGPARLLLYALLQAFKHGK